MKTEKGTLKQVKNGFRVLLSTKKGGTADHAIPDIARCFREEDADDGVAVEVRLDDSHRIVEVAIPGKPKASPAAKQQPRQREPRRYVSQTDRKDNFRGQPRAVKGLAKASPAVLDLPFHNPYTFLPFAEKAPTRNPPTPLSVDELDEDRDRFTGVLELEITTNSPLLTCNPKAVDEINGHKVYEVLKIGRDVVVPSTGIRGALRTLLTILTSGTLGYLNQHVYLCQGRDANLGPRGLRSPVNTPNHVFLAEVIRPGTAFRSGVVRLGQTRLVRLDALERCNGKRLPRGPQAPALWVGLDEAGQPIEVNKSQSSKTPWKLKVSGRPINLRGKREGVFLPGDEEPELPAELWAAYSGRHAHGDRPELKRGDLIWLEPKNPNAERLEKAEDIRSIQWARWGRRGQAMKDHIEHHAAQVIPDNLQNDGRVDEVTNLFGQTPDRDASAPGFAARVRPENLVFVDAASQVERVTLAPLAPPHPGCIAFYRLNQDSDNVSEADAIRGYKVYRTTQERGEEAPWRFQAQGVYDKKGELLAEQQKVNKTCDLLAEGTSGALRITFRALTKRELALLIQACAVPWRLGGGKPLGLGLCSVRIKKLIDEHGEPLKVSDWTIRQSDDSLAIDGWERDVSDLRGRVRLWKASQTPAPKLRYPRAVDANQFGKSRGGHAWFQRHASPRMVKQKGDDQREAGLDPLYINGELKEKAEQDGEPLDRETPMIAGQLLPIFDPEDPLADVLYGYDGYGSEVEDQQRPRRKVFHRIEEFDPNRHITGKERSEGSHGKDAKFRKRQKRSRRKNE